MLWLFRLILDSPQASLATLRVKDDSVGSLSTTGGFGLLGARERVQALSGQLRTESQPGQGFFLEVELPRNYGMPVVIFAGISFVLTLRNSITAV